MKTYTFHVEGMHCHSCSMIIEQELGNLPEIHRVKASLSDQKVEVTGEFGDKEFEHIVSDLSLVLKPHGYALVSEKFSKPVRWRDFQTALPLAGGFILLFILLQKSGLINLSISRELDYGAAFIIGLVASVSTCMAVVGGLTLSLSANFTRHGDKAKPQVFFHFGRFLSFFFLGGLIGRLGAVFQLGANGFLVLNLVVALVLLILGLNLLEIFPWLKKFQLTMPGFIGKKAHGLSNLNHVFMPFLVGAATFFLPCGFTQSMQVYTLTTGNFLTGALIMFSFALGTFPVLALLSFSSLGLQKIKESSIFFKTAGLVVIFFAILNLANALAVFGIIPPLFNF